MLGFSEVAVLRNNVSQNCSVLVPQWLLGGSWGTPQVQGIFSETMASVKGVVYPQKWRKSHNSLEHSDSSPSWRPTAGDGGNLSEEPAFCCWCPLT